MQGRERAALVIVDTGAQTLKAGLHRGGLVTGLEIVAVSHQGGGAPGDQQHDQEKRGQDQHATACAAAFDVEELLKCSQDG